MTERCHKDYSEAQGAAGRTAGSPDLPVIQGQGRIRAGPPKGTPGQGRGGGVYNIHGRGGGGEEFWAGGPGGSTLGRLS